MTQNGIVHLAFHPRSDALIMAAADKSGHVALWSIDNAMQQHRTQVTEDQATQSGPAQQGD